MRGQLTAALIALSTIVGQATYYAPGLMQQVYANRLAWRQVEPCPECVGMVALLEPGHIGRRVWLTPPGGEPIGPLLVVDCAQAAHRDELEARGWAVDVSWELGARLGMRGPLAGVTIDFEPPVRVYGAGRRMF